MFCCSEFLIFQRCYAPTTVDRLISSSQKPTEVLFWLLNTWLRRLVTENNLPLEALTCYKSWSCDRQTLGPRHSESSQTEPLKPFFLGLPSFASVTILQPHFYLFGIKMVSVCSSQRNENLCDRSSVLIFQIPTLPSVTELACLSLFFTFCVSEKWVRERTENDPLGSGEPEPLIKSPVWYLGLKSAGNSHIIANYGAAAKKKQSKKKREVGGKNNDGGKWITWERSLLEFGTIVRNKDQSIDSKFG